MILLDLPGHGKTTRQMKDSFTFEAQAQRVNQVNGITQIIVGFFYFCQYLHIGAGILSFRGDVFRM